MANILANLIAPNYSRFDFIYNVYFYDEALAQALRPLDSFGCKTQTAHFNIEGQLRRAVACADPVESQISVTAQIHELERILVDENFCIDLSCFNELITGKNPLADVVRQTGIHYGKQLAIQRFWGDKAANPTDLMDGYMTLIQNSTSVQTIPGASAAIVDPNTVFAEMDKVWAATFQAVGSAGSIIISNAVHTALIRAGGQLINSPYANGEYLGLKVHVLNALSFGPNGSLAGIALGGVFGDDPAASLIWYHDANDVMRANLELELIDRTHVKRNTYNLYTEMAVLPIIVNEANLVAYYY